MKYIVFALLALCVAVNAQETRDGCMCHIKVSDEPAGKEFIRDVFVNNIKVTACNEEHQKNCKEFCSKTENEKTNKKLSTVSKISNKPYGDILCEKLGRDVEKKSLKLISEIKCGAEVKHMETGVEMEDKLTCKAGKFVKA